MAIVFGIDPRLSGVFEIQQLFIKVSSIKHLFFGGKKMREFLDSWSPRVLSVLRIMTGFLFIWHGTQKLFGYPPPPPPPPGSAGRGGGGLPPLMLVGGILEFVGGLLFLLGFLTRPVAFILSGMMAVAYWMAHGLSGKGFLPIASGGNGGELAALYCFVFLYFVFSGPGPWSVDNLIWKDQRNVQ
jgi:putative oxidoreductase